jgi:phosphatidylglycerophosphate synthase
MEIDALLILVLSVAALILEKAGSWVLLIGLMRYGFALAQWMTQRLRGDLPASFRRKLICVVQVGGLCLILAPPVRPFLSNIFAITILTSLIYSFAVDVRYLLTRETRV